VVRHVLADPAGLKVAAEKEPPHKVGAETPALPGEELGVLCLIGGDGPELSGQRHRIRRHGIHQYGGIRIGQKVERIVIVPDNRNAPCQEGLVALLGEVVPRKCVLQREGKLVQRREQRLDAIPGPFRVSEVELLGLVTLPVSVVEALAVRGDAEFPRLDYLPDEFGPEPVVAVVVREHGLLPSGITLPGYRGWSQQLSYHVRDAVQLGKIVLGCRGTEVQVCVRFVERLAVIDESGVEIELHPPRPVVRSAGKGQGLPTRPDHDLVLVPAKAVPDPRRTAKIDLDVAGMSPVQLHRCLIHAGVFAGMPDPAVGAHPFRRRPGSVDEHQPLPHDQTHILVRFLDVDDDLAGNVELQQLPFDLGHVLHEQSPVVLPRRHARRHRHLRRQRRARRRHQSIQSIHEEFQGDIRSGWIGIPVPCLGVDCCRR
jgi:hypothetical protein